MKKVAVAGAAGFLGSMLCRTLLKEGCAVIGIDNLSTGKPENMIDFADHERFTLLRDDVASPEWLTDARLRDVTEIYHLASPASPKFYQAEPFATILANTAGTRNMLELARRNGAKLLYASTSEVYGDPDVHPQPEAYRGNVNTWGPRACYDEAKRLGEVYCFEYVARFGVKARVARIFNTYAAGLRNDDGRVISTFVTQALANQALTIFGDGTQTRSFCYVDDTIRGLLLLMEKQEAEGEIVNIGNPVEHQILEVAKIVVRLSGCKSGFIFRPLPQDDPRRRCPDIAKAKRILGWEPQVTLEQGLTLMIDHYRKKSGHFGGKGEAP
ncbi:MAG TPA: NAD-dependent epimerase/dehydratase family protein [Bacilli bacterium]